jgi:adenylate cyclase
MAQEIERKFLVIGKNWRGQNRGIFYRQGYLTRERNCSIRVRAGGGKGYLTVKGETHGAVRDEFEYEIPVEDANELLGKYCQRPLIEKWRYEIEIGELTWEVDEFESENTGLILAEVELTFKDQEIELPDWIGEEVTGDARYYNVNLVENPFSKWNKTKEQ